MEVYQQKQKITSFWHPRNFKKLICILPPSFVLQWFVLLFIIMASFFPLLCDIN